MSERIDAARLQPRLLGVALVSALIAAAILLLAGRVSSGQAQSQERAAAAASLSQNIPLQAGAAVRGSAPAFDSLAESQRRLERLDLYGTGLSTEKADAFHAAVPGCYIEDNWCCGCMAIQPKR